MTHATTIVATTNWRCDTCGLAITVDHGAIRFAPSYQWSNYPPGWGRGLWSQRDQRYGDLCPSCVATRRLPVVGKAVAG
jgi:hypothetical protein